MIIGYGVELGFRDEGVGFGLGIRGSGNGVWGLLSGLNIMIEDFGTGSFGSEFRD